MIDTIDPDLLYLRIYRIAERAHASAFVLFYLTAASLA